MSISVFSADVTFNSFSGLGSSSYPSGSTTIAPITLASSGWYGYSASQLRVKSGATITISCAAGYKITKVVFTATSTSYNKLNSPVTWNNSTGTYTNASGTNSITFTNSAQCRFSKIVVTYSSAASTYTVSEIYGPRKVGPTPPDPFMEPIGDITLPMLLFFGIVYFIYKNRKKIGEQH